MLSRIEVMGPIMPVAPLPHRPLHPSYHFQVVEDVPGTGGESCSLHQGSTRVDWEL